MANALFPKAKAAMLRGELNFVTADIRALLIDSSDYTYDDTDEFLTDIAAGAQVKQSNTLAAKAVDAATARFSSDPAVFPAVTGDTVEALMLYLHTGVSATARVIAYFDTGITGQPLTPDSSDVRVSLDDDYWFQL